MSIPLAPGSDFRASRSTGGIAQREDVFHARLDVPADFRVRENVELVVGDTLECQGGDVGRSDLALLQQYAHFFPAGALLRGVGVVPEILRAVALRIPDVGADPRGAEHRHAHS